MASERTDPCLPCADVVLTASAALCTWRDQIGVHADEAAQDIDWKIGAVVAAASRSRR